MKFDITLESSRYLAEFDSDHGGFCGRLYHKPSGSELLRTPESEEMYNGNRFLFGNPILFPPNRVRNGEFTFEGREYRLPINDTFSGCHLHGDLHRMPFTVERTACGEVDFLYRAERGEYEGFPHAFTIRRRYTLSDATGLREITEIRNDSSETMPVMLGFHTTFRLPFCPDSKAENCSLTLPVGRLHKRDEKYLPTCEYEVNEDCERLNRGEFVPADGKVSSFFEASGNTARLVDRQKGLTLEYRTQGFRYWMLFNGGSRDFLSIEPQTCAIDAFHIDQTIEEAGVLALPPSEALSFSTEIAIVETIPEER